MYISHSFTLLFLIHYMFTFMQKLYPFKVYNSLSCTHLQIHQQNQDMTFHHSIKIPHASFPFVPRARQPLICFLSPGFFPSAN